MSKYIAGTLVRIGNTHFNEGEELPPEVEKLSNFDACVKDGTFKLAGAAPAAPVTETTPPAKPVPAPASKPQK